MAGAPPGDAVSNADRRRHPGRTAAARELATEHEERRTARGDDAARAARKRVGHITQAMDAVRDQRGLPWLQDFV